MIIEKKLSLNGEIIQGKGNIVSQMGEEKVMFSMQNGKYYNLGEIGGAIWDALKESIVINELVNYLMSVYQIEQQACEEQVLSFLENLFEEGLIELIK